MIQDNVMNYMNCLYSSKMYPIVKLKNSQQVLRWASQWGIEK